MKPHMTRTLVLTLILAAVVWSPALLTTLGAQGRGQGPAGFPDLVSGLKATPGCLGVETARTSSGKQVIFAWFENKTAVLNWYYSDMHQTTMRMFGNPPARTPMPDVPDDGTPIMAIASLTMAPPGGEGSMPFSQLAIELYRPLPGGIALGGRFAPSGVTIPGLRAVPTSIIAGPNK